MRRLRINLAQIPKLLQHFLLQVLQLEPLKEQVQAADRGVKSADDPGVVGAGSFADDVEASVGDGADQVGVEF